MRSWRLVGAAAISGALLSVGCGAPTPRTAPPPGQVTEERVIAKRLTAAIFGDPRHLGTNRTDPGGALGNVPGSEAVEELLQTGLATIDDKGRLQARLAEAVPTFENGLWTLLPDGRMRTTWRIRDRAQWHDGTPFTSSDLLFTARVYRDRDVPIFPVASIALIEDVGAPDPRTVSVTWSQPFVEAGSLFTGGMALPLPKHLLEPTYLEDKTHLMDVPYWTDSFVGTGAYKLKAWTAGSHVALEAFDGYVMGRPKVDEIEIRFIYDANALIANVASGLVDLTMGRGLDIEQSLLAKAQRSDVEPLYTPAGWVPIYPQFLNPTPLVVADVRLRRALLHAIDRQEIVDSVTHGLVPVAHSFVHPSESVYQGIESSIVRYEFDPRRSAQLIEEIGYVRGPDGMYRDSGGRTLSLELWTTAQRDHHLKTIFPVVDYWQRVGVAVEPFVVPTQRVPDREYLFNFPAFLLIGMGNGLRSADVKRYESSFAGRAENRYQGGNMARYMNPEFDALIDRYTVSIPIDERTRELADIVRHQTDGVTYMGIFFQLRPVIRAQRLINVTPGHQTSSPAWNAHEWEMR